MTIRDLDLDIKFCRGQGYDGAGNMTGKCNGAATRIQKKHPKSFYVHYRSHVLISLQYDGTFLDCDRILFNAHPKRLALLTEKIKTVPPTACHSHLIDVCRTCWVTRLDGLD